MYGNHSPYLITTHLVKKLNQKRKQFLCAEHVISEQVKWPRTTSGLSHNPIYQMTETSLHRNSELERAELHLVSSSSPLVSVPQQIELNALASPGILSLTHTTAKAPLFVQAVSCLWMEMSLLIICYSPSTHFLVPLCFTCLIK